MNIDLGWLGKVVLEKLDFPIQVPSQMSSQGFIVTHDGYTESGIRVHGVIDKRQHVYYPSVWNNAIVIKLGDE